MARKILLADDSVTAQNMGRRILSDAGYDVITVNNGSAALKKIPDEKPDIVILDVYMPGYSGLEVCQRLRAAAETAHLPVLLTVGKLEPFKAEEARKVHADAHLVKPFEASELLAAIMRLEDKIVPQAEPRGKAKERPKSSGFEAPELPAPAKEKAGEGTGGWKNRLKISAKGPEVEAAEKASSRRAAEFRNIPHSKTAPAPPAPPNGVVQDITAEELAAIASAAAAFSDPAASEPQSNFAAHENRSPIRFEQAETAPEVVRAHGDSLPVADMGNPYEAMIAAAHHTEVAEPTPAVAIAEVSSISEAPISEAPIAEAPISEETHEPPVEQAAAAPAEIEEPVVPSLSSRATMQSAIYSSLEANDPDLAAALDSLAPVHVDTPGEVDTYVSLIERISSGTTFPTAMGAHWKADEVALSAEEATCILEQEMEKAYAAMRAERMAEEQPAAAPFVESQIAESQIPESQLEESQLAEAQVPEAQLPEAQLTDEQHDSAILEPFETEIPQEVEVVSETLPSPQTWTDMAWADPAAEPVATANEQQAEAVASVDAFSTAEASAPVAEAVSIDDSTAEQENPQPVEAQAATEFYEEAAESSPRTEQPAELVSAVASAYEFPSEASAEAAGTQIVESQIAESQIVESQIGDSEIGESQIGESHISESHISESQMADAPMIESMIAAVDENIAAESRQEAAFAAAAASNFGFRSIPHEPADAEPETNPAEPAPEAAAVETHAAEVPPTRAAELAAAWSHWKQIRDSVGSPQFTAQVANAAVAELRETRQETPAAVEPEVQSASEPDASDPDNIASIVDSVLADLRPKLVAEIARKLAKEKK